MYVNITGSSNNKDIYIYQSYRKENGKTSSRIFQKLGKYNELLERFDNDKEKLMAWAKKKPGKKQKLITIKPFLFRLSFLRKLLSPKTKKDVSM